MAMYKCKNFGSCSRADSGEEFSLATGTDDKCPECGSSLDRAGKESTDSGNGGSAIHRKPVLIASVVGVIVLVCAGLGYMKWSSSQVVILRPDPDASPVASAPTQPSPAPSPKPDAVPEQPSPVKPAPMVANEVAARKTCDEATIAKQPDADRVCRRATAITLMNSGVLAAVEGKLDQAEKDYLAAKDKDADFPELYFNLAVLKARQNKGSEAVDNLALASAKGFTQFSAIKNEPALQQIKSDPVIKLKIEAFEAK